MRILVTGGTGSFGRAFIRRCLPLYEQVEVTSSISNGRKFIDGGNPRFGQIVVFSRDELKQHEMREDGLTDDRLRYFIGDVRDRDRLRLAFEGVDVVVHAAAMKQVDTCEFNPSEAVKTNVGGTDNVIHAARDMGVGKVLMIGTDKAVDPVNIYGATKQTAEKLMVAANVYSDTTAFSCTRYGNVISSRGSVLPRFLEQHRAGAALIITDPAMTRFVLTLDQSVDFVLRCLDRMRGGEVFVPPLRTVDVGTIADAVGGGARIFTGRRPGEKQHELLISQNEPELAAFNVLPCPYGSNTEPEDRLSVDEFRQLAGLPVSVTS